MLNKSKTLFNLSSTDLDVVAGVSQTSAGETWLNALNNGATPTTDQIQEFFPLPLQQEIFENKLDTIASTVEQQIDPLTQNTFVQQRKLQRIAQVYYGGEGAKFDADIPLALGGETLREASDNLIKIFRSRNSR